MKARYLKYNLNFKKPSGTSRGILTQKETWFLILEDENNFGIGECGLLRGLSFDDVPEYENKLKWVCENIHLGEDFLYENLVDFPSIQFGLEIAFLSFNSKNPYELFPSEFTNSQKSIPINGLIWMGTFAEMEAQISEKIEQGFHCLKMKVGAIDFDSELKLLQQIREKFSSKDIEIRLDANGAFSSNDCLNKINQLTGLETHSIEQPIKQKNTDTMAEICRKSPIDIALDEELIGVFGFDNKLALLQKINPKYIILKPSFVGGIRGTNEWILIASSLNIGWWITSALESNIGLNAIAQYTFTLQNNLPQGLGTGSLYTNNFESPLEIINGELWYKKDKNWQVDL